MLEFLISAWENLAGYLEVLDCREALSPCNALFFPCSLCQRQNSQIHPGCAEFQGTFTPETWTRKQEKSLSKQVISMENVMFTDLKIYYMQAVTCEIFQDDKFSMKGGCHIEFFNIQAQNLGHTISEYISLC